MPILVGWKDVGMAGETREMSSIAVEYVERTLSRRRVVGEESKKDVARAYRRAQQRWTLSIADS